MNSQVLFTSNHRAACETLKLNLFSVIILLQLLNEAEYDMKNSAGRGGCYPPRLKAEVDNTLRDLQNSSYPTKAEFNNCFVIHSKYFQTLKGENELYC